MEKPDVLYHASENRDLKVFEPRQESVRHLNEGPVVFATPSKTYASMFLVRASDDWTSRGKFNEIFYYVINDEDKFRSMDKGGAIYCLSSETFYLDFEISGSTTEWVSKDVVKPIGKEIFDLGLQAMLSFGVQVYFVDKEVWKNILESDDEGFEILCSLESVNKKLNINYIDLISS